MSVCIFHFYVHNAITIFVYASVHFILSCMHCTCVCILCFDVNNKNNIPKHIFICLSSVPNGTCAGSGPMNIKESPTSQAVLKILVVKNDIAWFHTNSGSPSFSLTSFAELAFSYALSCLSSDLPQNTWYI